MYTILGIMSETSGDAIDLSILTSNGELIGEFGPSLKYTFPSSIKKKLYDVLSGEDASNNLLNSLEDSLTKTYIEAIQTFQKKYPDEHFSHIALHGQTVRHSPKEKITIQLGGGERIATAIGKPVIFQFRKNDIKHGGQGAPLAPTYHLALAKKLKINLPVAFINIGGVANVSIIDEGNSPVYACDSGPGNALIDDYCKTHLGINFDDNGSIARKGVIDEKLINAWLTSPYFSDLGPKSLDRNAFQICMKDVCEHTQEDAMATLTSFTAQSIALSRHIQY